MPKTTVRIFLLSTLVLLLTGCSLLTSRMTREKEYTFGSVKFLDSPSCHNLRVVEENTVRTNDGRLEVTITWENTSETPYKAKIRRIFIDEQGMRERGAYQWDIQTFPPGKTTLSWKSYSVNAVHYKIEIRSAD